MGNECWNAKSGKGRFFWAHTSPAEPALTVESDALKATGRPSMRPTPVTTASAGNSGFWLSANMPSSNSILPSSSRSLRRSRAKSFFCSRLRAWYFSAPPFLIRSISDANCSALSVMGLHSFSKSARERECPSRAGVYDVVEHLRFRLVYISKPQSAKSLHYTFVLYFPMILAKQNYNISVCIGDSCNEEKIV